MRGVAGEENPAVLIALGHHIARHPAAHRNDFVRHVLADGLPKQALGIDPIRRVVELLAVEAEAIQRAAVETDEIAP